MSVPLTLAAPSGGLIAQGEPRTVCFRMPDQWLALAPRPLVSSP
jgi:hypothetical protein